MSHLTNYLQYRARSFKYAFAGIYYALRTQPNTWIHLTITILCIMMAAWLKLPWRDWAVLVLAIVIVWGGELMNTAVEAIVDMTMPDPHPLAKAAKDVAAGAVLFLALGAAVVGLLILGPPLWARLPF